MRRRVLSGACKLMMGLWGEFRTVLRTAYFPLLVFWSNIAWDAFIPRLLAFKGFLGHVQVGRYWDWCVTGGNRIVRYNSQ